MFYTLERIRKKQQNFSTRAYGLAANVLTEHIGLPIKIIIFINPVFKSLAKSNKVCNTSYHLSEHYN